MTKQIHLLLRTCSGQCRLTRLITNRFRRTDSRSHLLWIAILLLTCLPLLATAQLVPLKTFHISLFAQTPEKSEEAVDKTAEKQRMQKAKAEKMGKKEYKDKSYIKVEDPTLFERSEENTIFSGPQPGEKLPPLNIIGVRGKTEGETFDITATADGEPLVVFLQDTNGVGIKGLVSVSKLLLKINALQKRHSKATEQGLQIGVVFLADNLDTLPEWAHKMLNTEIPNEVLAGISPDGREGPGSYGLNRNVAQTILIAKDGKVLHNFAFTQPMLYTDPHFLGAIAQALEMEPRQLEQWLNETAAKDKQPQMEPMSARLKEMTEQVNTLRERLQRADEKVAAARRENERRYRRDNVTVKDPAEFKKAQETDIFSGPQPGEKLPPLQATGINGEVKDKTVDFIAKADGQPLVLFLQDETPLGLRGLVAMSRLLDQIADTSEQQFHIQVVFFSDSPDTLAKQANRLVPHIPSRVLLGISQDGREGPGNYGLNRNVAQTILTVKDGKVLHNFALTQPMLSPDPHVLGAVGELIGEEPATLEKWLNPRKPTIEIENPSEGEEIGKMRFNGTAVQFDELLSLFRNMPETEKSMLIIQSGRDVLHEQVIKVIDIAKEAGIQTIAFALNSAEDKSMEQDKAQEERDDRRQK